jgi:5-hydroxyisourate hydrolase
MSMDRIKQDLGMTVTTLSARVLDVALGRPAAGLRVTVTAPDGGEVNGRTDAEGRARVPGNVEPGEYAISFETGPWFAAQERETCYPSIEVRVTVALAEHHEVVLALSPFAYATHREA